MNLILLIAIALASFIAPATAVQEIPAVKAPLTHPAILHPLAQAELQVLNGATQDSLLPNLLQNPNWANIKEGKPLGWIPWDSGFEMAPGAGPQRQNAVVMQRSDNSPAMGIGQKVLLNQERPQTISISGQSKAQNVSGGQGNDYSLYADIMYQDGTPQWGIARAFATGTHDWQRLHFVFVPDKPIKSLTLYALFRGVNKGQAWFCDLAVEQFPQDKNTFRFDGESVTDLHVTPPQDVTNFSTLDGLAMKIDRSNGAARALSMGGKEQEVPQTLAGFAARDVANGTGYYPLSENKFAPLQLSLQRNTKSTSNAITISGQLQDESGGDRAVSLVYAIPLNAIGWQWGNDISHSRTIVAGQEYSNTATIGVGSNGRISQYPLAALWHGGEGLAICLDMNQAAQFRVAYNADLKCLYIVYDIGMTSEKPRADFKFVIYRFDGNWGYRAAVAKMYTIFPNLFEVRGAAKKQGIWMPFSKIQDVQGWKDFGFRFREGDYDKNIAWDDAHDILTFRYSEPGTWWMPMVKQTPRDYQTALQQAQSYIEQNNTNSQRAEALLNSGMRRADGTLAALFRDAPWANGAVWSLNTLPDLSGPVTGAKLVWNDVRRAQYATKEPFGELNGEYLDSTESYDTADMDFDHGHFAASATPLSFDMETHQPGVYKGLMVYELARQMHHDLKSMGKYLFANSTPHRICFLTPYFDALGTETNWLQNNQFTPLSDQEMNLCRTLAGQKAYCLLQNTNLKAFGPYVEKYFQRSLFYGIFPSFFSADAATNPYWENPAWYNRDRSLFKKYIPLIQAIDAAGWQPVTLARSDNPQIRLERFGSMPGDQYLQLHSPQLYLTVFNPTDQVQQTILKMDDSIRLQKPVAELISGKVLSPQGNTLDLTLQAGQVMLLQLR